MKSIRISDSSYCFLKKLSLSEHRSLTSTLDLFISIFKEHEENKLETESLSSKRMGEQKTTHEQVAKDKKLSSRKG